MLECSHCEADLSNVPVSSQGEAGLSNVPVSSQGDVDMSGVPVSSQGETDLSNVPVYRICECGHANLSHARKCVQCGEDITDIMPRVAAAAGQGFSLISMDGTYRFALEEGTVTVGRNAQMRDYLADKNYVSRQHARLSFRNGEVSIENLSKTNYTYINNVKIDAGETVLLKIGDEIGLGGFIKDGSRQGQAAYFKFSLSAPDG